MKKQRTWKWMIVKGKAVLVHCVIDGTFAFVRGLASGKTAKVVPVIALFDTRELALESLATFQGWRIASYDPLRLRKCGVFRNGLGDVRQAGSPGAAFASKKEAIRAWTKWAREEIRHSLKVEAHNKSRVQTLRRRIASVTQ